MELGHASVATIGKYLQARLGDGATRYLGVRLIRYEGRRHSCQQSSSVEQLIRNGQVIPGCHRARGMARALAIGRFRNHDLQVVTMSKWWNLIKALLRAYLGFEDAKEAKKQAATAKAHSELQDWGSLIEQEVQANEAKGGDSFSLPSLTDGRLGFQVSFT